MVGGHRSIYKPSFCKGVITYAPAIFKAYSKKISILF
jgi:hypothetical protein